MVEQLDRTLAQVVEGWKRGESERQQKMQTMQAEHEQTTARFAQQQQVSKRRLYMCSTSMKRIVLCRSSSAWSTS